LVLASVAVTELVAGVGKVVCDDHSDEAKAVANVRRIVVE